MGLSCRAEPGLPTTRMPSSKRSSPIRNSALERLPPGQFDANGAWLVCAEGDLITGLANKVRNRDARGPDQPKSGGCTGRRLK